MPSYHGMLADRVTTLSPCERRDRDEGDVGDVEPAGEGGELGADAVEDLLVVVDEVHLVDAHEQVGHPQQRGQEGVAPGLLDDALAGVDQHHGQVGRRVPGDHVAGVLHVAGGVGDDELAGGRGEVAVGHVDGDALLALGPQPVGQQGEVGVVVAALRPTPARRPRAGPRRSPWSRRAGDRSACSCRRRPSRRWRTAAVPSEVPLALAVLHGRLAHPVVGAGGARSVSREAATSRMMSSTVAAADSTAPVQVMSPTVR